MNGGPSQMDLWDYKPGLSELFDKDLPDTIRKGQRITTMTSGNANIQHLWNGDIVNIRYGVDNPEDFKFQKCREGIPVGSDNFCIPVNSKHPGTALLFITHDLGVIAETAHRVVVMYAGVVAEVGTAEQVFGGPNHPYTEGLKAAIPKLGERIERLHTIPGSVPSPYEEIVGCPFQNRCPYVMDRCRREFPALFTLGPGHQARCFLYD